MLPIISSADKLLRYDSAAMYHPDADHVSQSRIQNFRNNIINQGGKGNMMRIFNLLCI